MAQESFTLSCPTDWKLVSFFSESRRLLQVVWKIRRGEVEVSLGDNICQVKCFDRDQDNNVNIFHVDCCLF